MCVCTAVYLCIYKFVRVCEHVSLGVSVILNVFVCVGGCGGVGGVVINLWARNIQLSCASNVLHQ